jgi:tetratricopeptide (TPR) repeat protein
VLTQETIYASIPPPQRVTLHQQVAQAIEALYASGLDEQYDQLAYHYERGDNGAKAVEYLLKAGEKARRAYSNDAAAGYFQRALDRLDTPQSGIQNLKSKMESRLAALIGLGEVHLALSREMEAEHCFRQAITLGQEMELAPRDLARIYFWLGEVLFWQGRLDERVRIGEEGLAHLRNDTESVEAVLMYSLMDSHDAYRELPYRYASFIDRLPYSEELAKPYIHLIYACLGEGRLKEADEWLQVLARKAEQHHDLRALGEVYHSVGDLARARGDLREAIAQYERAADLLARIGDPIRRSRSLQAQARTYLECKELEKAQEIWRESMSATEGRILPTELATQEWDRGLLGWLYLARGDREAAIHEFQRVMTKSLSDPWKIAAALVGLEHAYADSEPFHEYCRHFREQHPEVDQLSLVQWYLEPAQPDCGLRGYPPGARHERREGWTDCGLPTAPDEIRNPQSTIRNREWVWHDPEGDCAILLQNGVEIHAENGRDLWGRNVTAPRLLRPVSGDFAVQMVCSPAGSEKPASGGILLWKDGQNLLRLERGGRGPYEIDFVGSLRGRQIIVGRGSLESEQMWFRLERRGSHLRALCSADGRNWSTLGAVEFPVEDPVEIGLHAIRIDPTFYLGASFAGSAIRFEAFELWG